MLNCKLTTGRRLKAKHFKVHSQRFKLCFFLFLHTSLPELDSKKVRFDVRFTGNPYYITGQRIRFDQVITNENNAYNADSGIFTAPFNGTYFFVVTGAQYSDRVGGLVLGDDDTTFCRLQLPITSSISVSCQSTVYLYKGQQVSVKSEGQVYLSSPFSSFVGFSLDPDVTIDI